MAGIMGVLAILTPFVLRFSTVAIALWATLVLGVVVAVLAGYEAYSLGGHHRTS